MAATAWQPPGRELPAGREPPSGVDGPPVPSGAASCRPVPGRWMSPGDRSLLTGLFGAAVAAAEPARILRGHLPERPGGRVVVTGAGKGAAHLAAAFEELWDGPVEGVVVTRYGHAVPTRWIRVMEAAHPEPDAAGLAAAEALMQAVSGLSADDLVVALFCGGGSALLPMPPGNLTLEDERELNAVLLASGAPIGVMNAIRRHVSRIRGGRLAMAAHPARVVSLVVSDVPGDDPAEVASGPTVPSAVTPAVALAMARSRNLRLPGRIVACLAQGIDAPDPGDPVLAGNSVRVIASARLSLEAAAAQARAAGIPAVILSDAIEGEARDTGGVLGAIAREVATRNRPFPAPVVLLSGGETTVTMAGMRAGRGGPNTEFLLSLARTIGGVDGIVALAADTDGTDGSGGGAGALADGSSVARIRAAGMDPDGALWGHDSWTAFETIGDTFSPGPTGTNVNDFRAILVRR